jgi:IS4 transposase
MLFCQFGQARSLREISNGLASCEGKLRHLGIEAPARSTLSYANEHRSWELFRDVFLQLLGTVQQQAATARRKFRFKHKLYSMDMTVIDLTQSMFPWAHFRRAKGAVKLHLRLDHDGYLPEYAVITDGKGHEIPAARTFHFPSHSITVFDKAYTDFTLFAQLTRDEAYFVTRLKVDADYEVVEERRLPETGSVLSDQLVRFKGPLTSQKCPHVLRVITFYDAEHERIFQFLTNNLELSASTIAAIYKERWAIELFFKALKQQLRIKTFVGTSANAVKIQIWTALIAILLLKYLKLRSSFGWSLSNLAALLRMNLFTYRDLWAWLNSPYDTPPDTTGEAEQLSLAFD